MYVYKIYCFRHVVYATEAARWHRYWPTTNRFIPEVFYGQQQIELAVGNDDFGYSLCFPYYNFIPCCVALYALYNKKKF